MPGKDGDTKTRFQQQALPAWQPILTARNVLPPYFIIGVFFIPIGAFLIHTNNLVKEIEIDYTDCVDGMNAYPIQSPGIGVETCANGTKSKIKCKILINDTLFGDTDWGKDVFLYYGLENFYQNHRRYIKSKDAKQLFGDILKEPDEACKPFDRNDDKIVVPCGAIANSMFNDVIKMSYNEPEEEDDDYEDSGHRPEEEDDYEDSGHGHKWKSIPLNGKGIAWDSDKKHKFKNPDTKVLGPKVGLYTNSTLEDILKAAIFTKPPDWPKPLWELPDKLENEDFIVWMRPAALSNFRKFYRKINHTEEPFQDGLPKNFTYMFEIECNYNTEKFSGRKKVILATTSFMGGKNHFMGIAYVVVGILSILIGSVFIIIHKKYGISSKEMINIDKKTQYTHTPNH